MNRPKTSVGLMTCVKFGRNVRSRLIQDDRKELAGTVGEATNEFKQTGRAVQDAQEPIQDALAARDYWDDTLDSTTKDLRLKLASRSLEAVNQEPYRAIFHKGIDYYVMASLKDTEARYRELLRRMSEALAPDDALLEPTRSAVGQALTRYTEAAGQLEEARTGLGLARTARDSARENWERTIDRAYGLLFSELGRAGAERFFPKALSSSAENTVDEGDGE